MDVDNASRARFTHNDGRDEIHISTRSEEFWRLNAEQRDIYIERLMKSVRDGSLIEAPKTQ